MYLFCAAAVTIQRSCMSVTFYIISESDGVQLHRAGPPAAVIFCVFSESDGTMHRSGPPVTVIFCVFIESDGVLYRFRSLHVRHFLYYRRK